MIFIDSSAWIAYHRKEDAHNASAVEIFEGIEDSDETVYTSDYVFDEAVTVAMARTDGEKAEKLGNHILESSHVMRVHNHVFRDAWKKFRNDEEGLSFTDCAILSMMNLLGIEKLVSFDSGFENRETVELVKSSADL